MSRKLTNLLLLAGFGALAWFLGDRYEIQVLAKVASTFAAVAASYLLLKVVLEGLVSKQIRESKARYSFRKTTQLLFVVISFFLVVRVWVVDPQGLLVAYGLIAAGVAIALQDVFKNFAGALAILLGGIYRVGDRIEVGGRHGDVIDFGLAYTTLLELRVWVEGDQTTGRLTLLPNGEVLSKPVHNYTKDHNFIWDEITIPITYDSDWRRAVDRITQLVTRYTVEATRRAEEEISQLEEKYYISKRNIEPRVFLTPTDNWVTLRVRYVAAVRDRRIVQNELAKMILAEIEEAPDIRVASATMTVTVRDDAEGAG